MSADEMIKKQDIGLSRGGKNTKIHALVDGLGNPILLIFTGGEVHDSKEGVALSEGFDLAKSAVLGDKAFGTVEILTYIRKQGGEVVIPPKSNAKEPWDCDFHRYKERHLVECFFNKLKHFRCIATRYSKLSNKNNQHQIVIEMRDGGKILLELQPNYAPQTVENFINLANSHFYDGLTFHRIINGFMIQGGDPNGTGTGGSDKNIYGEFTSNGFAQNTLSHERGVISMARSSDPNSASSQFFICHADATFLDGNYAAFGNVLEGMDIVDRIAGVETDGNDKPLTEVVINTMIYKSLNAAQTEGIGRDIAAEAKKGDIYCLSGDLGAGKTVFAKGFAKGLGIVEAVTSPTFTLVNVYESGHLPLYHFDVYRLSGENQMYDTGYEEFFYGGGVCLVEWAENVIEVIPPDAVWITIEKEFKYGEDYRKITITSAAPNCSPMQPGVGGDSI
ncbi:peptidyl-prolyl cis-trans isomerase-related [Holotrichia oblita]|nr:peptidyl-prolyl cis-trans isomerase-related [Holotrichia oblita]